MRGELQQWLNVGSAAVEMHRDHGLGPPCYNRFRRFWIDIQCFGFAIGEDGARYGGDYGACSGEKCEGRNDHLVAVLNSTGAQGKRQSIGSGCHAYCETATAIT